MSDELPISGTNQGIQQSGGISITGTQAVGYRAQAYGAPPAQTLLQSLRELIDTHPAEVRDPAAAEELLLRFDEELSEAPADPGALERMLDRLNRMVVPFGTLAGAIGNLAQAFRGVVGH